MSPAATKQAAMSDLDDQRRRIEEGKKERPAMSDMKSTRAVVVGASRGFGRGIAEALDRAGANVHAVSELGHE